MLGPEGLHFRATFFHLIRSFFHTQGFLEVDTPIRQPVLLPESNITPVASGSWFLQTSPEQCMKRQLATGCDKIFQICPCFRAAERGTRHLEEFTMLEWYRKNGDYADLMDDCSGLVRYVLKAFKDQPQYRGHIDRSCFGTISVGHDWERISVAEAFSRWSSVPLAEALAEDLFDEIVTTEIEPRLGLKTPAFLYDYPAACASLARLKNDQHSLAERFELYIDGMELANGFSELTDAAEQRARFVKELATIARQSGRKQQMPEKFLADLERITKAAGIAFGLDRFLMLLRSASAIDEVISFTDDDWR